MHRNKIPENGTNGLEDNIQMCKFSRLVFLSTDLPYNVQLRHCIMHCYYYAIICLLRVYEMITTMTSLWQHVTSSCHCILQLISKFGFLQRIKLNVDPAIMTITSKMLKAVHTYPASNRNIYSQRILSMTSNCGHWRNCNGE